MNILSLTIYSNIKINNESMYVFVVNLCFVVEKLANDKFYYF